MSNFYNTALQLSQLRLSQTCTIISSYLIFFLAPLLSQVSNLFHYLSAFPPYCSTSNFQRHYLKKKSLVLLFPFCGLFSRRSNHHTSHESQIPLQLQPHFFVLFCNRSLHKNHLTLWFLLPISCLLVNPYLCLLLPMFH